MAGVVQQHEPVRLVHRDLDMDHVADLEVVGDGGDRALRRFEDVDLDSSRIAQERTAPAPRPERRDRRQRHERRVERQDRAADGEVVGRGAGRRRRQHAIGNEFAQLLDAVDPDLQLHSLVGLAREEHLVDRATLRDLAGGRGGQHDERVDDRGLRGVEPRLQVALAPLVHQEADRAVIDAEDRQALVHEAMQRLKHQAVAAKRDDHVGLGLGSIAVTLREAVAGVIGLRCSRRQERDLLEAVASAVMGRHGCVRVLGRGCRRQCQ